MTTAEACSRAAVLVLDNLHGIEDRLPYDREPERGQMLAQLRLIETWLRRRACGGDKLLIRQLERETGRQVQPTGKQARELGRLVKRTGK